MDAETSPAEIAIVGGGPGGLMTAYLLQKRCPFPHRITLFEASDRLGGKIVTSRFASAPVPYEAGVAELYDYSQLGPDPLKELIAELGLETRPMWGTTVVLRDRILRTLRDVGREFGDAPVEELRRFRRRARRAISPAEYYESDWKLDNDDPLTHASFQALLAKVSDPVARRYIEVAVHSDLATEPHLTNAMYGMQNYLMNERDYMALYTIVGGIERLPRELAARLTCEVRLRHRVSRIARIDAETYQIDYRHGATAASQEFDFVVVALPNNWLPAIEWHGETLAKAMRAHHAHYEYPAHYLRISILFDRAFWRETINESYFILDAFEGCCVYDETARGDTARGDTSGGPGVLGWLLAGNAAVNFGNLRDDDLIQEALASLPSMLAHGRAHFVEGRVHRWIGSVNGLPAGIPAREPDSRHVPEPVEHPGLFLVGDYLFDSTINGVLDSADVVAEWITEELDDTMDVILATEPPEPPPGPAAA